MRLTGAVLLLCLSGVSGVGAQERPRVEFGLTAGVSSLSHGFDVSPCDSKVGLQAAGLRAGVQVLGPFMVQGTVDVLMDLFECGTTRGLQPPITNGSRTFMILPDDVAGYPIGHASLRVAFEPVRDPRGALRLHASLGRFVGRGISTTGVGAAVLLGEGPLRLLIEGESLRFRTRELEAVFTFEDANLISIRERSIRQGAYGLHLRAGVVVGVGARQ